MRIDSHGYCGRKGLKRSTGDDFIDPEKLRLTVAGLNQSKEGRERPEEPAAEAAAAGTDEVAEEAPAAEEGGSAN